MHEFVHQPRLMNFGDDEEEEDYDVYLFWPSRSSSTLSEDHASFNSEDPLLVGFFFFAGGSQFKPFQDDGHPFSPESPLSSSSCASDSSQVIATHFP